MKREKYNTVQKNKVIEIIKKLGSSFSAKDIREYDSTIGLTTIYRELDELESLGTIKKFYNDKNVKIYEYLDTCDSDNHFYLKCNICGKTIHVDCECINDFSNHVLKEHSFSLNNNNIFISGICSSCRRNSQWKKYLI